MAILVAFGIGFRPLESQHALVTVPRTERMGFWIVGAGMPGGFLACSLYLKTNEADGDINQRLLFQVGTVVHAFAKPFVVGGDWQMEHDVLPSGWVQAAHGAIKRVGQPTCISTAAASEIDYFVVGHGMQLFLCEVEHH